MEWPESLGGLDDQKVWEQLPERVYEFALILVSLASCPPNLHALGSKLHVGPLYSSSSSGSCNVRYSPGLYIIRAFTGLDPRGVFLDRVSRGIRRYLREREDTVRFIVRDTISASLPPGSDGAEELSELSRELRKGGASLSAGDLDELDYDGLTWSPDPVDAGPGFKWSKGLMLSGAWYRSG